MSAPYSFIKMVCDNVLTSVFDLDYDVGADNLIYATIEDLDKIADYISHAIGDYAVGIDKTGGDGIATIDIFDNDDDGNYYITYSMYFKLINGE